MVAGCFSQELNNFLQNRNNIKQVSLLVIIYNVQFRNTKITQKLTLYDETHYSVAGIRCFSMDIGSVLCLVFIPYLIYGCFLLK